MGKIFAGLLFVFLHFRINGFDLLPDFVGYLLIWLGMRSVRESETWQENFSAIAACGVSVIALFSRNAAEPLLGLIGTALQLLVLYAIAQGALELEEYTGCDMRAGELRKSALFAAIWVVLAYVGSRIEFAAAVVPAVLAFAGLACYIVYYFKAWKAFEEWQNGPHSAD